MMITINSVNYKINQGHQIKTTLTNELHSVAVVLDLANKHTFKKYDIAHFRNKKYLIGSIHSFKIGSIYETNLSLIELTYILEKYILSPCSFKNPSDNLKAQIEKLLYKVEPIRVGETPRFTLSQSIIDFLGTKPGEDFVYSERMTLREILDDMLSSYGVRCYVEDLNQDFSSIIIGYLDLNKKSVIVKSTNNIKIEKDEEIDSSEVYADEFDILVQNTQSTNNQEIIHEWQALKPVNTAVADTNTVKLIVDFPIEQITRVSIQYKATINFVKDGTADSWPDFPFDFDITDIFIEQELYETLPVPDQEKSIPYQRGSTLIGVLDTYKPWFLTYVKLRNYLMEKSTVIATNAIQNLEGGVITNVVVAVPTTSRLLNETLFRVIYVPRLNFHYKQSKDNKDVDKRITSVLNQTDRSVDIDKFSKAYNSMVNMIGNKGRVIEGEVKSESELLELGDRIENGYSLVSRELSIFNTFIKFRYGFSQHYQATVSARLSRERRLYNIPQENLVERSVLIKDNLFLSTEPIPSFSGDSHLTNSTLTYLINSFNLADTENRGPIDRLLIQTKDKFGNTYPDNSYYSLNFVGRIVGKSIIWQARTQDNYSVGLSTGKKVAGGRETHLNSYVDVDGEFESMSFRFINSNLDSLDFDDQLIIGSSLPLIPSEYLASDAEKPYIKGNQFSLQPSIFNYVLEKDRLEYLSNITYQLEANAQEDITVIGPYFLRYLKLLSNRLNADLYVWVSPNQNDMYRIGETHCKGTRTTSKPIVETDIYNRIYTDYSLLANMFSWAIGTHDGRLVLAVNNNKQVINSVYFGLKRN